MNRFKWFSWSRSLLPIIVFLVLWEGVARLGIVSSQLFPPFSTVMAEFYYLSVDGTLGMNLLSSLLRVLAGFILGTVAGIMVGIIMGWKDACNNALHPLVSMLYPIPALGWLPLLMLWIGINELLPIMLIFICSFFPLLYNTVSGIKNVNEKYVQAARILGASDMRILATVVVPLAVPSIFTGLRLEAGMAWRVIIAAEMVAIPTGIGALMIRAESLLRIDIIIVCLIVLAVMCFIFERFFAYLENKLTVKWRYHAEN